MASPSSDKGKRFEREIAKTLSKWCDFKLIRTPMSGAWSGSDGDIVPESRSSHFPLSVECKHQKDFDFSLLFRSKGIIISWVNQSVTQSLRDEKKNNQKTHPLLIFKKNRQKPFVAFPYYVVQVEALNMLDNFMLVYCSDMDFVIITLELFISKIPYSYFITIPPDSYGVSD